MSRPKKDEKNLFVRQNISLPPELVDRIVKYCQDEERTISYVARKSIEAWLNEKGY